VTREALLQARELRAGVGEVAPARTLERALGLDQPRTRATEQAPRIGERAREPLEHETRLVDATVHRALERALLGLDVALDRRERWHRTLGRVRRCRRAHVRAEVRERHVDLVAHARDDRHARARDRTRDALVVEGREVLARAATAREEDHAQAAEALVLDRLERAHDLLGRLGPLHHGVHEHEARGEAIERDLHDVAPRRAVAARHDADRPRIRRQRTLARRIEQALGRELLLEARDLERPRAEARLEDLAHLELVAAARLVEREAALHLHARARSEPERDLGEVGAVHHALHLGAAVAEHEVEVPRARARDVGDLPLHPHARRAALEQPARELVQRDDAQRAFGARSVAVVAKGHPAWVARAPDCAARDRERACARASGASVI
jgi:hypothetical protein